MRNDFNVLCAACKQQIYDFYCILFHACLASKVFCIHTAGTLLFGVCKCSVSVTPPGPSGRIPPIIRQGPANQTVSLGATVQLHCRVVRGTSVKISWEKDGERLQGNKLRVTLMENGTLQITDVKVCMCEKSAYGKGFGKVRL